MPDAGTGNTSNLLDSFDQRASGLDVYKRQAEDLVPGDRVLLQSGDKVPADLRLIEIKNLRIQEAALTGEAEAVEKSVAPVAVDAAIGDRTNMAYSGTLRCV